jgi:hypothetical protein
MLSLRALSVTFAVSARVFPGCFPVEHAMTMRRTPATGVILMRYKARRISFLPTATGY